MSGFAARSPLQPNKPAAPQAAGAFAGSPARVLICDDSAVIRGAIARLLSADPGIRVVAQVANGRLAVEEVARHRPDVVVLDIEMPVMDGITALPLLLKADPTVRIIMASTLTTRGADIAMQALRRGAADYVPKPSAAGIGGDQVFGRELVQKVIGLARQRRRAAARGATGPTPSLSVSNPTALNPPVPSLPKLRAKAALPPRLLAIASSTGGPQALFMLAQALGPGLRLPIVLTQHMPAPFMPILADHISRLGGPPCAEARDGEKLAAGRIYLAPGDRHLLVRAAGEQLHAELNDGLPENFCRPSADPMLRSAAIACQGRVLVLVLTGMGHDGLGGTRAVIAAGGAAVAQDEETSVVWGMPGAIAQAGLCQAILPLARIGGWVLECLGQ